MDHWQHPLKRVTSKIVTQGLDLLFYHRCPLCDRLSPKLLCPSCRCKLQALARSPQPVLLPSLPPLIAWGQYEGALKQALAQLKYRHQPKLAVPLGHWLATAWAQQRPTSGQTLTVVPIPLHRDRQHQRGYNQASLIAESFCERSGLPLKHQGLIRQKPTAAQHQLSRQSRQQNLKQAFALGRDLQHIRSNTPAILLIDDIFTTGATMSAAVETLAAAGISTAALLTVAYATPYRPLPTAQTSVIP